MAPTKLTDEQFEFFVSRCRKYIGQFGLVDWDIAFVKDDGLETALARCEIDSAAKMASISIACNWGQWPISQLELEATAYHEVLELLLSQIQYAMLSYMGIKEVGEGLKAAIDEATHRCIMTLTNAYVRQWGGADVLLKNNGAELSLYNAASTQGDVFSG